MSMNDYKVTIAVPVYGVESYVEKCAKSLFEQTYSNLEILIIKDCTPDKSVEIINKTLAFLLKYGILLVKGYSERDAVTRVLRG